MKGDYFDAIVRKGSRVVPMIIETTGGIAPHSRAVVARLARRARRKGGRDGTVYGASRTSTRSFYVHHVQQMSVAAQKERKKWGAIVEEYVCCRALDPTSPRTARLHAMLSDVMPVAPLPSGRAFAVGLPWDGVEIDQICRK